jgi:CheY-like chemotaxis protein
VTWDDLITLIRHEDPRLLNDKRPITADPFDSDFDFIYAVWDRLELPVGILIHPEHVLGANKTIGHREWVGAVSWMLTLTGTEPASELLMMATPASSRSLPLLGVTVLLIEAGVGLSEATQGLLEDEGACVAVAANGRAALDVLEAVNPDVVLCDVKMPAIDVEFPRGLRADLRFARFARLPVIALTVLGGSPEHLRTVRANFDGYIVKPVGALTLMAVVHHLSRRSEGRAGQSSLSDRRTGEPTSNRRHVA